MSIISMLSKIGWSWPLFLFKSYVKKQFLFKKTSWANKRDDETIFVKRLTLASILYLEQNFCSFTNPLLNSSVPYNFS